MYLLGYDIGSSSVKASLFNTENGQVVASSFYPKTEMSMIAVKPGWAEQEPDEWWKNLVLVTKEIMQKANINAKEIKGIGISYQMHGLVLVDKNKNVLRPSIIWCDSRAVPYGEKAFADLGAEKCLSHLLNSPGNFTAAKLKWVKENEPEIFKQIFKIMLPGDYIAMRLTDRICTTASGLSEGILWDFSTNSLATFLMDYFGFPSEFIPEIVPTFSVQGELTQKAAEELGLVAGIPIAYRAGDQPNNAFSLNVLNPGEIAATAGTSGVVYGVSEEIKYDSYSRVNTFAHVNHNDKQNRLGVLLCINGTGILNSWIKRNTGLTEKSYDDMNRMAAEIQPGSNGLLVLPFGNGAERMLRNKDIGCHIGQINFNLHSQSHLVRAAQEGIVYAFNYGIEIMKGIGISTTVIRAGKANMFLSPIFTSTLAAITGATIELYNTDGSVGAARGAGVGTGLFKSFSDAFIGLNKIDSITPDNKIKPLIEKTYQEWLKYLNSFI
ncbi:MAG: FGGY family carbohydrate kinase [Bacteroidales bacterium]|nr:FGGY family carbohydrate kinase [Bacteroidales bacterium]